MLRILAILLIGCTWATACSEKEKAGAGAGMDTDGKCRIQVTLSLKLPVDGTTQNDPSIEEGTVGESKVSDAIIVLGRMATGGTTPIYTHSVHYLDNFRMSGNHTVWKGVLQEAPGFYKVVVIANPLPGMWENGLIRPGVDWTLFERQSVSLPSGSQDTQDIRNIWSDGHFMMTNSFNDNISEHEIELVAGKHNYKEITVQRVCARFDYEPVKEGNTYTFTGDGGEAGQISARLVLTDAALTNMSRSFYLMKMFSADEAGYALSPNETETGSNYVADTDWKQKKDYMSLTPEQLNGMFYFSSVGDASGPPSLETEWLHYRSLPTVAGVSVPMAYASENTVPGISRQINKLSTGIVFRGYFTFDGTVPGNADVYYYKYHTDYRLATSWQQVAGDLNLNGKYPECPSNAELAKSGIRKYTPDSQGRYPVWYTYWNRHNDNHDPNKMGIMEFAVVRNNIYKLKVTKVSTLGLPEDPTRPDNPWRPDGNTPDEEWPGLDVVFEVRGWNERSIDIEI